MRPVLALTCCLILPPLVAGCDRYENPAEIPARYGTEVRRVRAVVPPEGGAVALDVARAEFRSGAFRHQQPVEIRVVDRAALPPLAPGMINVTPAGAGYRFLPSGSFRSDVELTLPLDTTHHARAIWSVLGARTFYWDERQHQWAPLAVSRLLADSARVVSQTRHFTLMINAVLKAPEAAAPTSFAADRLSAIGAADPAAGIDLIAPPEPTSDGDARVSYPLRLPRGTGGFSPELILSYSSNAQNGPIGVGWSLPVSAVSIDTRWGVPRYNGKERYTWDGQQLVDLAVAAGTSCKTGSVLGAYVTRLHTFNRILHCGTAEDNHWEITAKNGIRFDFGLTGAERVSSYRHGESSHVGEWRIARVVDPDGNTTLYSYQADAPASGGSGEPFTQLYLKQVTYTSHPDRPAFYRASLSWNCAARPDALSSGRYGFQVLTRCRLDVVASEMRDTLTDDAWLPIRSYALGYKEGAFGKSLLAAVQVVGPSGAIFYEHTFDYTAPEFQQVAGDDDALAFEATTTWPVVSSDPDPLQNSKRRLERTSEDGRSVGLGLGGSFKFGAGASTGGCEIGLSAKVSIDHPDPVAVLRDFDGDGRPDRVWIRSSEVRAAISSAGQVRYGVPGTASVSAPDLPALGSENASGGFVGLDASCSAGVTVSGGVAVSIRLAAASALLMDADGDQMLDLLTGDSFYRGLPHNCRDGAESTLETADSRIGICTDGLKVCADADYLCFMPASVLPVATPPQVAARMRQVQQRLAVAPRPPPATPPVAHRRDEAATLPMHRAVEASASTGTIVSPASFHPPRSSPLILPSRAVTAAAEGASGGSGVLLEKGTEETTWGFHTSVRRRLAADTASPETYPLNPVIRWDAQHTGNVHVQARVRRKHIGGSDGVTATLLLATDFTTATGTAKLAELTIGSQDVAWKTLYDSVVGVTFGNAFMVVVGTGADAPVSVDGVSLDEVELDLDYTYEKVCSVGVSCRAVTADELGSLGPTGQATYVYHYPEDFRQSELPREAYWQLLPPIGKSPTVPANRNRVLGEVSKLLVTDGPVHVRVRCESIASRYANDGTVCPLGTVLAEAVFGAADLTTQTLEFTLPESFRPVPTDGILEELWAWIWGKRMYDPLRLLFEVDGENGAEIQPAAINWRPRIELYGIHGLDSAWAGRTIAIDDGYVPPDDPDLPRVTYPGVLFRVHPARDLKRFQVAAATDITVEATAVASSHPLIVSVLKEGTDPTLAQLVVTPQDVAANQTAVTRTLSVNLPGAGTYAVRAYTEASFATGTSYRVTASMTTTEHTGYMALVRNGAQSGISAMVGAGPMCNAAGWSCWLAATQAITQYYQLDHSSVRLAQIAGTPAEAIARRLAPHARLIVVPANYSLSYAGYRLEPAGAMAVRLTFPDGRQEVIRKGLLTTRLVELGIAHATILPRADAVAQGGNGTYLCCPKAGTMLPANTIVGPDFLPVLAADISFTTVIQLPVNLLSADYGGGYRDERLVGEVPHSLEPYGGGHQGFFYGVFNGDEALNCVSAVPCAEAADVQEADAGPSDPSILMNLRRPRGLWAGLVALFQIPDDLGHPVAEPEEQEEIDDGDHLRGVADKCPLGPEDYDGFEDEDGCAESGGNDLDEDKIPDPVDRCPFFRGDMDGNPDTSDCPIPNDPIDQACTHTPAWNLSPDGCEGRIARRFQAPSPFNDDGRGGGSDNPEGGDPTPGGGPPGGGDNCLMGPDPGSWFCGSSVNPTRTISMGGASLGGMRETWNLGVSAHLGVSVEGVILGTGVDATFALSSGYTDRDVMDWNGDGLPDFISPDVVMLRGRDEIIQLDGSDCYVGEGEKCVVLPSVRESFNTSFGLSISGGISGSSGSQYETRASPGGRVRSVVQGSGNFGVGVNANHGIVNVTRADMNGDGLPDLVYGKPAPGSKTSLCTRLNLGYRLGEPTCLFDYLPEASDVGGVVGAIAGWLQDGLGRDGALTESQNLTLSKNAGISAGVDAIAFGASISGGTSRAVGLTQGSVELVDLNGDGLLDIVRKNPSEAFLHAWINTGSGTLKELPESSSGLPAWNHLPTPPENDWVSDVKIWPGEAVGAIGGMNADVLTGNGTKTKTDHISASATVFFAKVSASYTQTEGFSFTQLNLADVDGDGLPDRVLRSGQEANAGIQVQRNRLGGANLLAAVNRPLGGRIVLQYQRRGPEAEDPTNRWLLTGTSVEPLAATASWATEPLVLAYQYQDPYYDRYERSFLGHRLVRTMRADGSVVEAEYANREPRKQAFRVATRRFAQDGVSLLTEEVNEVALVPLTNASCPTPLPGPIGYVTTSNTPCHAHWMKPVSVTVRRLEGGSVAQERKQLFEVFDEFGNATQFRDQFSPLASDQTVTVVRYDHSATLTGANILDRADSVVIRREGSDGDLLRLQKARYDNRGRLTRYEGWADEAGTKIQGYDLSYGDQGFLESIKDGNGYSIAYTPDGWTGSFAKATTDAFGLTSSVEAFDYRHQSPTRVIDANGQAEEREFDEFGRLLKVWGPYELAANTPAIEISYDPSPVTGPGGSVTTNRMVDPATQVVVSTVRTARFIDPQGREIQTQVDAAVDGVVGRILSPRVVFDGTGRRVVTGEPVFRAGSAFAFEALPADGDHETTSEYDGLDRMVVQVQPGDRRTTWDYQVVEHPRRAGVMVASTAMTDPNLNRRRTLRDPADRVVAVVNELDGRDLILSFDLLPTGEIVQVQDALGRSRHYEYDLRGQQLVIESPETGRREFEYDGMGNLIGQTDSDLCGAAAPLLTHCGAAEKVVRTYAHNRLTGIDYPTLPDVRFVFGDVATATECPALTNVKGRVCRIEDGGGVLLQSYGPLGEVVDETRIVPASLTGDVARSFHTGQRYDGFARLLAVEYPDGEVVHYGFDAAGRPVSVTGTRGGTPTSYVTEVRYTRFGTLSSIAYGNGLTQVNEDDPLTHWRTRERIERASDATVVRDQRFSYDLVGNISSVNAEGPFGLDLARTYTYDDLYRLTNASVVGQAPSTGDMVLLTEAFTLNDVGDLQTHDVTLEVNGATVASSPARSWTYLYADASRPGLLSGLGPFGYGYDTRGNLTSATLAGATPGQVASYGWDEAGRLATSTMGQGAIPTAYSYGHDGSRVAKATAAGTGPGSPGARTVYPGKYVQAEYFTVADPACAGGAPCEVLQSSTRTNHIYLGRQVIAEHSGIVADASLAGPEPGMGFAGTAVNYLHTDRVGSVTLTTDATGQTSEVNAYLAFGEPLDLLSATAVAGTTRTPAFNGKELDRESGLYSFGARYLDGQAGRWVSADGLFLEDPGRCSVMTVQCPGYTFAPQDPIRMPGGVNLYAYADNNPTTLDDPNGLCPWCVGAVAGAILGGGGRAAYNYVNDRPLGEGVLTYAIGGAVAGATLGAATAAFGAETSIWAAPVAARGADIEQRLGSNLPRNFPTIDRFANGVATSIKSLDLGAKTYQSGANLLRTLNGYVDKVADFGGRTWAGVTVQGGDITQRVLQVAIPEGRMNAAQQAAFDAATSRAAQLGVTLETTVVP